MILFSIVSQNWYWEERKGKGTQRNMTKNIVFRQGVSTQLILMLVITFADLGGPKKGRCVVDVLSCSLL